MSALVIKHAPECLGANISEYWHENDNCHAPLCQAEECLNCGEFATECESN